MFGENCGNLNTVKLNLPVLFGSLNFAIAEILNVRDVLLFHYRLHERMRSSDSIDYLIYYCRNLKGLWKHPQSVRSQRKKKT